MENNSIGVYARMKPANSKASDYKISKTNSSDIITFKRVVGSNTNKPTPYSFRFNKIFENFTNQSEIFALVAKPVVDRVLQGYNGTIMAYGQTGSGKTYTITGSSKTYDERGIVPRTLECLYRTFQEAEAVYTVHISYLEIYNECGYDLLTRKSDLAKLEEYPRVTVLEDANQKCHIRNLSLQPANDEGEALELLFLGDTNRVIAETPVNPCSSRSHCVFTIHLTSRIPGSTKVRRSKLHLVDLAGSERASKVGLNGVTLREAKSINRSLHFLERVTAALTSNTSTSHVPYRNSLLTNILRDSLGGNCLTTFVITLASDASFLPETLSSCRFSQRAAMIKNVPVPNEEPDLVQEAALLRDEVARLKEMLAHLVVENKVDVSKIDQQRENAVLDWNKGKNNYLNEELPDEVKEECKRKVDKFISEENSYNTNTTETILDVGSDTRCIQLCFQLLRQYLQKERDRYKSEKCCRDTSEILQCKQRTQERENEISILINLLQEEKLKSMKKTSSDEVPSKNYVDCIKGQPATPLKTPERTDDPQKFYQCSLYNGTSDEEQLAFMTFIDAGGIGGALKKEVEERNEMFKAKCNEAKQITQELQTRRETIITLCQQLNESKESIGCWYSQTSEQEPRENTKLHGNINSKIPIHFTEAIEVELKKEQEAYKYALTKLQRLKSETNHLNQSLKQAEVQLKVQFKSYWNRIQISTMERGTLVPTQVEFCDPASGTITENTAQTYPHDPNWPANFINSKIQGFESNPSLNILKQDILHYPALLSQPINPPCTTTVLSSSHYPQTPNVSPYMQTPMQINQPECYIQTSNQPIFLATPNSPFHVTTLNPSCSVPSPYTACNVFPPNQPNISTLCYYKTPDQRFNKCEFKDAHAKSKTLSENEASSDKWYPMEAYKPDMTQSLDCISGHVSENSSNNDRLLGANSNFNQLTNSVSTPREKLIQSSESKIATGHRYASQITTDFYNSSANNRYSSPEVSQESNQLAYITTSANNVYSYGKLPLTGDKEVDEEILAFYRARNRILDKGKTNNL